MSQHIEAAQFGDANVLVLVDQPAVALGPDEVRIAVGAAGVNPADTLIRSGVYEFLPTVPPFTPGLEAAGMITEIGANVRSHRVGDRVWAFLPPARRQGAYAETLVCDANLVHPLPDDITLAEGAALGLAYVTAYRALVQRGDAQSGESVLVHGASGGVGTATVQIAVALGMRVIGTASTPEGVAAVTTAGAEHVLDHTDPDHVEEVQRLTGGGADLIVEMRADLNLAADLTMLARNGRVVIVGARGPATINPRGIMGTESDIRGTVLWNMTADDFDAALAGVQKLLEAGAIKPVVGATFALADAAAAQQHIVSSTAAGKVVLLTF